MKRIALTTTYLTVISTLAVAQLPNPSLLNGNKSALKVYDNQKAIPFIQQANEFAPLTNLPFFPGGQQALAHYLESLDLYPYKARETQIEGTVRVQFRVLPSGHLTEIQVVKSRGPLLDKAAIQTVALMPRWYPAHRAGMTVSCLVELNIRFVLD